MRAPLLVLTILAWPFAALAEDRPPVIAVFDIDTTSTDIKKTLAQSLTEQLRVRLAATKRVVVIDKTEQEAALKRIVDEQKKASYAACVDEACQIPLGKELAANRILRTKVSRFGKTYVLSSELVDLVTGGSAGGASIECDGSENGLLEAVASLVAELAPGAAGTVAAGSATLGALPALSGKLAPGGVVNLDVDADLLVAYDAALKADSAGAGDPGAAAAAWEAVAARTGKNPYRADAAKRAKEWRALSAEKQALEEQRAKDLENLKKLIPLDSIPEETKIELTKRYAGAYGNRGLSTVLSDAIRGNLRQVLCDALIDAEEYPKASFFVHRSWAWSLDPQNLQTEITVAGRPGKPLRLPPCSFSAEVKTNLGHHTKFTLEPLAKGETAVILISRFRSADGNGCGPTGPGCRDVEKGFHLKYAGRSSGEDTTAKCAALEPKGAWRVPTMEEVYDVTKVGRAYFNDLRIGSGPPSLKTGARRDREYYVFAGDEVSLIPNDTSEAWHLSSKRCSDQPGFVAAPMRPARSAYEVKCVQEGHLICVSTSPLIR